jgi:hypothetical protein
VPFTTRRITRGNEMAKMDSKLVARDQQHEVSCFAPNHGISAADARVLQRATRRGANLAQLGGRL